MPCIISAAISPDNTLVKSAYKWWQPEAIQTARVRLKAAFIVCGKLFVASKDTEQSCTYHPIWHAQRLDWSVGMFDKDALRRLRTWSMLGYLSFSRSLPHSMLQIHLTRCAAPVSCSAGDSALWRRGAPTECRTYDGPWKMDYHINTLTFWWVNCPTPKQQDTTIISWEFNKSSAADVGIYTSLKFKT